MERLDITWLDDTLRECLFLSEQCVKICEHTAVECERIDGADACRRACRDCADLCTLLVRFIARHAALTPELSEVCSKACTAAATECGRYQGDTFRTCADICNRCANLCSVVAI